MTIRDNPQRRTRLREVISLIEQRPKFRSKEIQFHCREASPAFVTKVLNQLHKEGIIQTVLWSGEKYYSWNTDDFAAEQWIDRQIVGEQVTQAPNEERPRERLLRLGADQLKTSELLSILIRLGKPGESAVSAGGLLAQHFAERLGDLPHVSAQELKDISPAVSQTAYCQIMAGIELGRRVAAAVTRRTPPPRINSTSDAIQFCRSHFDRLANDGLQEEFHIVTLDTKHQPIQTHRISIGTLDASLVHPREVFKPAIRDSAMGILLVHNHPSGDSTPSRQDIDITSRLRSAGDLLGIKVIDHIIVAKYSCVSLAES